MEVDGLCVPETRDAGVEDAVADAVTEDVSTDAEPDASTRVYDGLREISIKQRGRIGLSGGSGYLNVGATVTLYIGGQLDGVWSVSGDTSSAQWTIGPDGSLELSSIAPGTLAVRATVQSDIGPVTDFGEIIMEPPTAPFELLLFPSDEIPCTEIVGNTSLRPPSEPHRTATNHGVRVEGMLRWAHTFVDQDGQPNEVMLRAWQSPSRLSLSADTRARVSDDVVTSMSTGPVEVTGTYEPPAASGGQPVTETVDLEFTDEVPRHALLMNATPQTRGGLPGLVAMSTLPAGGVSSTDTLYSTEMIDPGWNYLDPVLLTEESGVAQLHAYGLHPYEPAEANSLGAARGAPGYCEMVSWDDLNVTILGDPDAIVLKDEGVIERGSPGFALVVVETDARTIAVPVSVPHPSENEITLVAEPSSISASASATTEQCTEIELSLESSGPLDTWQQLGATWYLDGPFAIVDIIKPASAPILGRQLGMKRVCIPPYLENRVSDQTGIATVSLIYRYLGASVTVPISIQF